MYKDAVVAESEQPPLLRRPAAAQIEHPTDAMISRRIVTSAMLAASTMLPPSPASGWCGAPFPPYAYSLPWFEFPADGAAVRVVGDAGKEKSKKLSPLLVLPPPGLTYEYLETLEALTISERRVAFAALPASAARSTAGLARAATAALTALESPKVHVLGHGLGAAAALALYAERPDAVASLTLASPYAALSDVDASVRDTFAESVSPLLRTRSDVQARACVDAELLNLKRRPATQAAAVQAPLRDGTLPPLSTADSALLRTPVSVPVLLTRGRRGDVSSEATAGCLAERLALPAARILVFEQSASLAHVDERAAYAEALLDFLDASDGASTRRAVMLPGSMRPGGSIKS